VRRLTLEPDPEIVAPELADAIERVLDERRPADELAARLREVAERSAAAGGDAITLEAEPAPDALDRACRSIGFDLVRTMLQLRRPLPLPAEWPRPETPRLRSFRPGRDEQAWLDVNHRAFEWHPEQGDWTLADLRQRESEPWFRPEGFLVLDGDAGDDEDGVAPRRAGGGSTASAGPRSMTKTRPSVRSMSSEWTPTVTVSGWAGRSCWPVSTGSPARASGTPCSTSRATTRRPSTCTGTSDSSST
jgi:hypothetical protein